MRPSFFAPRNPGDPDWDAAYVDGRTQSVAIDDFRTMARKDSKPGDLIPNLAALKPSSPTRTVNVRFTLMGDFRADNPFLFKNEADIDSRRNAGLELPNDFKPERSARIGFIPLTLRRPKWVYKQVRDNSVRHIYVACVASDEYFAVVVNTKEMEEPKFEFWTAFEMGKDSLDGYRNNRTLLYSEDKYRKMVAAQVSGGRPESKKRKKS